MLTTLLYYENNTCIYSIKIFITLLRSLVFFIIFIAAVNYFSPENSWFSFITENSIALISYRVYQNLSFPYIYFLASPMLIYLMGNDLYLLLNNFKIKYLILFVLTTIAFIFTGTRSHIIIGILFLPAFLLILNFRKYYKSITLILSFFIILIFNFNDINLLVNSFFSKEEASNTIKLNMISNYKEIFVDPYSLIFGQGFNAHEWSEPLRQMIFLEAGASKTELTYLEIFRVFGVLMGAVIIFSLLFLVFSTSKIDPALIWLFPCLIIFLVNASLNPYLFSTNGILPIALILSIIKYNSKNFKIN